MVIRALVMMAAAAATAGCGSGGGTLTGTVSHKGKPLAMGFVTVYAANGLSAAGEIQSDGTYRIEGCPGGKLKIAVSSPKPVVAPPTKPAGGEERVGLAAPTINAADAAKWFAIPERYADPDASGLVVEASGDTTHNITLD